VALPLQSDESLELLVAPVLLSPGPIALVAIALLPVACSFSHVSTPRYQPSASGLPAALNNGANGPALARWRSERANPR